MFTLYTVLLTLHILLVVMWLGAGITQQVIATRLATAGPGAREFYFSQINWFGRSYFPAVSGLTAVFGVLLWIDGPWELGTAWLWIAVGGWIISSFLGSTQLGARVERLSEGYDERVWAEFTRFVRFDTLLLVLILADMVIKPFS